MRFLYIISSICLFFYNSNLYAENNATLMPKGEWKDPKTGLIWMRCTIGQKFIKNSCEGNGILFTSEDAKDYINKYVNPKYKLTKSKAWRIPEVEEFAAIRACTNGWLQDIKQTSELTERGRIYKDKKVTRWTHINGKKLPSLCSDSSKRPAINGNIFPNLPKPSTKENDSWQQYYWTATPANKTMLWNINLYNGLLGYANRQDKLKDKNWEKSFNLPPINITQYILLVRDE